MHDKLFLNSKRKKIYIKVEKRYMDTEFKRKLNKNFLNIIFVKMQVK